MNLRKTCWWVGFCMMLASLPMHGNASWVVWGIGLGLAISTAGWSHDSKE